MGATRLDLRRRIGEMTGDLDLLTATASGSTTEFVDILNLALESAAYAGRFGYFSEGTAANTGSTIRVTTNDKATTKLTFTPAVTSATATGDVLELYNRDGQGPKPSEIHRVINICIESVSRAALTEVIGSTSTFDIDSPTIAIPSTWRRLVGVEFQHPDTEDWWAFEDADLMVDRVGYTVRLDNYPRWIADTNSVRLRGYTKAPALTDDTTETAVDAEWLEHEAARRILLRLATSERVPERRAADYRATAQYYGSLANTFRAKVPVTIRGGWVLGT